MKIIDYDKSIDKKGIVDEAYVICNSANFPVTYQDVYDHLFGDEEAILKLLISNDRRLAGFGVFENYDLMMEDDIITMLYLSGMVIDPKYQGKNISREIIRSAYRDLRSDLISLRTQNIAMVKSLIRAYNDNLFEMPGKVNDELLECLKQAEPFRDIDDRGVIRDCYANQLYNNLDVIQDSFGIKLQECDALGVVIEPRYAKQKVLSRFGRSYF